MDSPEEAIQAFLQVLPALEEDVWSMPDLMINGLRRWLSRLIGHAEIATDLGYGLASTERPSGRKRPRMQAPADAELHFLSPGLFF